MPVGYLPQETEDFFLSDTLEEDILINLPRGKGKKEASLWLDLLGLENYRGHDPRQLSAGEKRRAALACLLAADPLLLLLDEPGTGMDGEWKQKMVPVLRRWCHRRRSSLVVVTHDVDFAGELADRVLFMHNGEILADGPAASALNNKFFYSTQAACLFRGFNNNIYNTTQARNYIRMLFAGDNEET